MLLPYVRHNQHMHPVQAGWTPLMYACQEGHLSIVKLLVSKLVSKESGWNVNVKNKVQYEITVLH